jgi:prepilin-type N-terminal cleavage/methylation domain-containing protein
MDKKIIKNLKNRQGFSLAEVLIVVAIAASVVVVVSNLGNNITLLNGFVSQQLQSASDITQTLQIITTEIRSAEPAANGAYPIDAAASSSFAFYSDINKNGTADHVRYFFASSTIYKGVIAPVGNPASYPTSSEVITDIIDHVIAPTTSTPLFQYYDASYTGTQTSLSAPIVIPSIRILELSFNADIQPKQAPGPEYFSILVDIRNLRSN